MPKESVNREDKASGSGDEKDSLQKAADQISEVDDEYLASMFIEANEKASLVEEAELFEIYSEKEKHYEHEVHEPDPALLKSIADSLKNKEFHHKKLLEEGEPTGFFSWVLFKLKKFFAISNKDKKIVNLSPLNWKKYLFNRKILKKEVSIFFDDFFSFLDLKLRDSIQIKKILKYESFFGFLSFFLNLLVLLNFSLIFSFNNALGVLFLENWKNLIFFFSLISLIFIIIPPIFLLTLWFVNVNFLHTSRNFHFFVFIFSTISYFLLFLVFFNIFIFFTFSYFSLF